MKKILASVAFIGSFAFFLNCSPKTTGTVATQDNTVPAPMAKTYNEEELNKGKGIWQASCDKCHKLYEPSSRSAQKWDRILPRMSKRAKLEDGQAELVRAYIMANTKS